MPDAARVGDAISHGGEIIEGSPNVTINGRASARQGDAVMCRVHGRQTIVGGSATVSVNGRAKARVGDAISCGAVIASGSANVTTGG